MFVFDLHSDTLFKSMVLNKPLDYCGYEFRMEDFFKSEKWIQCMAMWIPDDLSELPLQYRDRPLIDFFIDGAEKLNSECKKLSIPYIKDSMCSKGFILTLENSSLLDNKIENIEILSKYNVKLATLTWNAHNCVGDGAGVENPKGLTDFGKEVVKEYNRNNIAIDLSHASDTLFYDVASINKGKIVASHSNSRKICNHKRNLTDEQFCYIRDNNGLVGLNFHKYFLKEDGNAGIDDLICHAEHFLSLNGENTLAIGSDFDGSEIPREISNTSGLVKIYNKFIAKGISKEITDKIFYKNAFNFFN